MLLVRRLAISAVLAQRVGVARQREAVVLRQRHRQREGVADDLHRDAVQAHAGQPWQQAETQHGAGRQIVLALEAVHPA